MPRSGCSNLTPRCENHSAWVLFSLWFLIKWDRKYHKHKVPSVRSTRQTMQNVPGSVLTGPILNVRNLHVPPCCRNCSTDVCGYFEPTICDACHQTLKSVAQPAPTWTNSATPRWPPMEPCWGFHHSYTVTMTTHYRLVILTQSHRDHFCSRYLPGKWNGKGK